MNALKLYGGRGKISARACDAIRAALKDYSVDQVLSLEKDLGVPHNIFNDVFHQVETDIAKLTQVIDSLSISWGEILGEPHFDSELEKAEWEREYGQGTMIIAGCADLPRQQTAIVVGAADRMASEIPDDVTIDPSRLEISLSAFVALRAIQQLDI